MRRRDDPLFRALVEELDEALVHLQTARRVIADIERRGELTARTSAPPPPPAEDQLATDALSPGPSLRYSGMTVAEAAVALGVGEEQVRRLLRRGELVGVPFGGRVGWRLSREYVDELVAEWQRTQAGKARARAARAREAERVSRRSPKRPAPDNDN